MDIAWGFRGKSQMMAKGKRRLLFNGGKVWDVTDALKPELVNDNAYAGFQAQLAWNNRIMNRAGIETTICRFCQAR